MFFFPAVLFAALVGSGVQGKSCSLTLQTDLDSTKEPLVLGVTKKGLSFVWPAVVKSKGVLTVADGGQLLLSCTGSKNYQTTSGDQSVYATCSAGCLTVDGLAVDNSSTACSSSYADSSVKVTDTVCGSSGDNTGVIVELGFELEDGSWFPLVSSCHNIDRSATLYSAHQVYGASIKGSIKSSERRSFSRGPSPLYPNVNPESVYVRSGQKKAFNTILGSGGADKYISTSSFLSRGHLSPDADFIYNSGQLATYYHVNVAPQWQVFNAGNWLAVENAVRDIAAKVATTLNVWTGTYGILTLEGKEIYLDATNDLIPAPEVFWKVIQNPDTNTCTVAIGTNNPFLTVAPTPICSTSSPSGWPTLTSLKKGYGYYCSYEDFKSVVDYVPETDCDGGLLEFP